MFSTFHIHLIYPGYFTICMHCSCKSFVYLSMAVKVQKSILLICTNFIIDHGVCIQCGIQFNYSASAQCSTHYLIFASFYVVDFSDPIMVTRFVPTDICSLPKCVTFMSCYIWCYSIFKILCKRRSGSNITKSVTVLHI